MCWLSWLCWLCWLANYTVLAAWAGWAGLVDKDRQEQTQAGPDRRARKYPRWSHDHTDRPRDTSAGGPSCGWAAGAEQGNMPAWVRWSVAVDAGLDKLGADMGEGVETRPKTFSIAKWGGAKTALRQKRLHRAHANGALEALQIFR